jgi:carboxylate-amine ligase
MTDGARSLHLFEGLGLEWEYMIVDAHTRSVLPLADEVLRAATGEYQSNSDSGEMGWSNELALHVVELKTKGPVTTLAGVGEGVQRDIARINAQLAPRGGCLMPTGMHPWMDPRRETRLWPHEYRPVYEAFHRIFDCRGHGWSNVQSLHLNLPFNGDDEFARLHAAIRIVLPLLPALAASSPFQEGRSTDWLDSRLQNYRFNCARVPSVTGQVIPEPVFTEGEYRHQILERIYRDIAPHDPAGDLRDEWLNARGAIARFQRNTIEIRLLDIQENPFADLAIAEAVWAIVRGLVQGRWADLPRQKKLSVTGLESILAETIRDAEAATIRDREFLLVFGLDPGRSWRAGEIWSRLLAEAALPGSPGAERRRPALDVILGQGCLARRIRRAAGPAPSRDRLRAIYGELCGCLAAGKMFAASDC